MKKNKLMALVISSLFLLTSCSGDVSSSESDEPSTFSSSSLTTSSSEEGTSISEEESVSSAESSTESSISESEEESDSSSSSSEEVKTFSLVASLGEGVSLEGLPSKAEAGQVITFKVVIAKGFSLKTISAKAGSAGLALTAGLDDEYSFTMPKRGVTISVSSSRKNFKLAKNDSMNFIASIEQKKIGTNQYVGLGTIIETETDEDGEETETSYSTAEFGAEVLVHLTSVSGYKLTGIKVTEVGTIALEEGADHFSFLMPAVDTFVTIEYDYTPIPLTVNSSSHLIVTAYKEDKATVLTDSLTPYSEVYLKVTNSEDNQNGRYVLKTLSFSYKGNSSKNSIEITEKDDDGFYHFRAPKASEGIVINVTEFDNEAYADADFVGAYQAVDFSNGSIGDIVSFDSKLSFQVEQSGKIILTNDSKIDEAYSVTKAENGVASLVKGAEGTSTNFLYDGKAVVVSPYLDEPANDSSFLMAAFKKEEGKTHSVKATQFKIGNLTYAVACLFEGETLLDTVLITRDASATYSKNTITFGVDLTMLEGDFVTDKEACFSLAKDGVSLAKIGYSGAGGAANRTILGEEYGDYLNGDKTLHLNGGVKATYDNEDYTYAIDGDTIVLTSKTKIITGTVDLVNKTFVVLKEEEASALPVWSGHTFRGLPQWSYSDSDTSYSWRHTISFHGDEMKYDISDSEGFTKKDVDYEVVDGNTINATFYNTSNKGGFSVALTYHPSASGIGYFTAKGGVSGAYFKDTKLSLVS